MKLFRHIAVVALLLSNFLSVDAVFAMHDTMQHKTMTQDMACQAHCLAVSKSSIRELNTSPTVKSVKIPVVNVFSSVERNAFVGTSSPARQNYFDIEHTLQRTVRSIVLRT